MLDYVGQMSGLLRVHVLSWPAAAGGFLSVGLVLVCCRTSWSLMCAGCSPAEQSVGLCLDFIVCVIFTVRPSKRGTKRQWE